jgi:phthiocerol/phenolphthiocerol synthesis type-I polyketide synthase E
MTHSPGDSAAVVGLACRVPGARDAVEFWDALCRGRESITRFTAADLRAAGVPDAVATDPRYVPAGGWLEGIDRFDAGLFGIPHREAAALDPQHRVFLECAWTALEDAALRPGDERLRIGVFGGSSTNDWLLRLLRAPEVARTLGTGQLRLGVDRDHLVSRVAYRLGLTGPAMAVQTTCSSSLSAVHLAVRSLLTLECDVALAGG